MKLRQLASHHYIVLVVLDPIVGDAVLSMLKDSKRFYIRLFEQITAALTDYTPTYGPPFAEKRNGVARAKRLTEGISEFIALNRETRAGSEADKQQTRGTSAFESSSLSTGAR
jgi:hypothetical protein